MHDLLLDHQGALSVRDLVGYAGSLGLDTERFFSDLRGHAGAERVRQDTDSADFPAYRARRPFSSTAKGITAPTTSKP